MIIKFCQYSNRYFILSLENKEYCSFDMFGCFLSDKVAISDIHCRFRDVDVLSIVDCSDRKSSEMMFDGYKLRVGLPLMELVGLVKKNITGYVCSPLIRKHEDAYSKYNQILFVYDKNVLDTGSINSKLGISGNSGWSRL